MYQNGIEPFTRNGSEDSGIEFFDPAVETLARKIAAMIYVEQQERRTTAQTSVSATALSRVARARVQERRQRDALFEVGLFGEPAWDMLLDLYIAAEEGKTISVSSLCIAAATPQTTALRWINHMVEKGMVLREDDERDRRRVYVRLAPETQTRLGQLLSCWQ